jgi:hypothetical protein
LPIRRQGKALASEEGKVIGKLTVGSVQQGEKESNWAEFSLVGEMADDGTVIGLCRLHVTDAVV